MLRLAPLLLAITITWPLVAQKATPSVRRHASSDLELITLDPGGARKASLYLSRSFLSTLPQTTAVLKPDENFRTVAAATISGIDLDVLIKALAPGDPSAALVAVCRDGYTSPFPRRVILDHHPILVLTIDGLTPQAWSMKQHAYNPSPYFVTYKDFVPSFRLLAHQDFPQRPAEIVRVKVLPAARLFAAITPPKIDQLPTDSPILTGFHIAQQNCFRCHNSGDTGGTKAQRSWQHLAQVAKSRPAYFAQWVHNPQTIDPKAKMTPNLQYDQATLNALARYFQTLAP